MFFMLYYELKVFFNKFHYLVDRFYPLYLYIFPSLLKWWYDKNDYVDCTYLLVVVTHAIKKHINLSLALKNDKDVNQQRNPKNIAINWIDAKLNDYEWSLWNPIRLSND